MENKIIKISLEAARRNKKMSQQFVAEHLKVSRNTIVNWERGYTKVDADKFHQLCELYQMSTENIELPEPNKDRY